jgi:hypothetical protein
MSGPLLIEPISKIHLTSDAKVLKLKKVLLTTNALKFKMI